MTIKPIKTERDYQKALKEIEKIWDARPNTPTGDRLDVLATLVEAYGRPDNQSVAPCPVDVVRGFSTSSSGHVFRNDNRIPGNVLLQEGEDRPES